MSLNGLQRYWMVPNALGTISDGGTRVQSMNVEYGTDAFLLFGRESAGIDPAILDCFPTACVRIPMRDGLRSLNLSNAVAIATYEALRQQKFPQLVS